MGKKCCYMKACPNHVASAINSKKKYFRVPTGVDEETKSAWEHFINNGNRTTHFKCGSKGVRLCEDHFEPDLIGKLRLVKFAKPTIYPEYTPASAFKENLIPAEENSPYLEHLNDFRMPVTEWASKQEALMENVVVPLEGEGETIIGDSDFIDCDEQPLLDEATGLLYDPTDMPMLGDVQSFDPQATSSFGHDPVQKQSTVSDPVVEVMETKDPESGCSLHTSNMENISNCETPRIDRKRKIDKGPVQSGKRRAYVNDLTLNAFKSPRSAKRSMDLVKRRFNSMQARAKVVGQRLRRAVKKIRTLTDLLDHLKQEGHVDQQFSRIIENAFPEDSAAAQLFRRLVSKKVPRVYPAELKKFALTLHFHSPSAYEYVREKFSLQLPHPRTIRKLYATVDGTPGFTQQAKAAIKKKAEEFAAQGKELVLALMCDEMVIRRKLEWVGGKCVGYADHGDNMHSLGDDADLAKEAWVFMVVSVNDGWKLPVGYFLIASLDAKQRANIMKECLLYLDKTGATVASVTFDGNSSNISCVESLGACLNPMKVKWQPWFIHPSPQRKGQKVYVILDPAHMLKLWRNTFGNESIQLLDAKDTKIKFDYLKKLHELQQTEGLLAGNRLRQRHVFYEREKMKVRLAAQLLSRSTADALEYLRDDLKMPDFKDCAGTVEFIRLADIIFDILNSRNCQATEKQKQPLSANNINFVRSVNNKAIQYIKALNIKYNTKDGITQKQKLLYSKWKTGFIGFLGGLDVALRLYTDYVQTGVLKFIPLYKFSQDHLETFFSGIRGRGGWDPNPSALKFMSAYKKLLVHTTLRSNRDGSNCWPLEFISILNVSSSARLSTLCRNDTSDPGNVSDQDVDDLILAGWDQEKPLQELISLSAFTNDVVEYIAGYVGKGLLSKLNCPQCALALTGEDSKSLLLKRKNRGGLFIPSSDLIHVCRMTERSIRQRAHDKCLLTMALKRHSLYVKRELDNSIFNNICNHDLQHRNNLLDSIIKKYLVVRVCHDIKKLDEQLQPVRIRAQLNKVIIFNHQ